MGKKSLIKSTSKQKAAQEDAVGKEAAPATPELESDPKPEPEGATEKDDTAEAAQSETAPSPEKAQTKAEDEAAEPAAAEVSAAEGADLIAAQRAARETSDTQMAVSYDTPSTPPVDPANRTLMIGIGCIVFLLVLVIGASISNSGRYSIKTSPAGIEIWKGRFAPQGEHQVIELPGVVPPEESKAVYNRNEVYPLACQYFIDRADALLTAGDTPDFDRIKSELQRASDFAVTRELSSAVSRRISTIDLNNLLYKADVAAQGEDLESLAQADDYLHQASGLDLDDFQKEQIAQRRAALETQKAERNKALAAEAAAEAEAEAGAAASHTE